MFAAKSRAALVDHFAHLLEAVRVIDGEVAVVPVCMRLFLLLSMKQGST